MERNNHILSAAFFFWTYCIFLLPSGKITFVRNDASLDNQTNSRPGLVVHSGML